MSDTESMTQDEIYESLKVQMVETGYLTEEVASQPGWTSEHQRCYESWAYHHLGRADFRTVPMTVDQLAAMTAAVHVPEPVDQEDEDLDQGGTTNAATGNQVQEPNSEPDANKEPESGPDQAGTTENTEENTEEDTTGTESTDGVVTTDPSAVDTDAGTTSEE